MKDITDLIGACEDLCDSLRKMRRESPNEFFESAHEKLLKNIDAALNGYYVWAVTEQKETRRLNREIQELRGEIQDLERQLAAYEEKNQ